MSTEMSNTSATNVVEYDANKHSVHQVTVYQSNTAEVKRKIQVKLENGQNNVEIKNLPSHLEESSIRVDGIGNATIFDVIYHRAAPPKRDTQNSDLQNLVRKKAAIDKELEIYRQQERFVESYAKTLSGGNTQAEGLETFLDVYSTRQTQINENIARLEEERKNIEKEIKNKSVSLNTDEESVRLRGTRITIIVLANEPGDAELSLTYVVPGARWTPQYDLRARIAPDEKSESSVNLHYRASIAQATGEDWTNVILTLSTASPLLGTQIPSLAPYWIGARAEIASFSPKRRGLLSRSAVLEAVPPPPPAPAMSRFLKADDLSSTSTPQLVECSLDGEGALSPPAFIRSRDVTISSDGAVSKAFTISGMSNIPSDNGGNTQAHKVSIAELEFSSVGLRWISVPKSIASVFLQCKVKNTSDYVLLAGKASVFLNGNFVSKSSLPRVSPQESFSCSLGVDPAVRITYHPQRKKVKTVGGSVLTTKTSTTVFEQSITVKNTRLAPLRDLRIRDQIPVSTDARIKVNILEPTQIIEAKHNIVNLSKGISVKWVRRDEDESEKDLVPGGPDVNAETAQGMFEWKCEIEPGASKDVTLSYEVSAPSTVSWEKQ